jgi:hypothetical protein
LAKDLPMTTWNRTGTTDPVRTAVRFPIRVAVHLKTPNGDVIATTENISANGLLFTCDRLPGIDTRIEFTILMPAEVMGTTEDVQIQCIGRVVRHQIQGEEKKAAVIIDEYFLKA